MTEILVTIPVDEKQKAYLTSCAPDAHFTFEGAKEVSAETVKKMDIIIGNAPAAKIQGSPNLKWLQLNSAGTDGYCVPGVLPDGCKLTNATGAYGLAISEHMIASLLYLMKKLNYYAKEMETGNWSDHGTVTSIEGANTLVIGFGNIGSDFARKMNALGSHVIGIRRNQTECPDYLDGLYQMDKLDECVKNADIVVTCLPGTKETYKLYNAEFFKKMKDGAYFVNIGRGTAVDSLALADALNSGKLSGAAVDVTDPEPLPSDHPLWKAKNMLVTPHISGNYHLPETKERIIRIAGENLKRFLNGEELNNIVDFQTGYRKFQK